MRKEDEAGGCCSISKKAQVHHVHNEERCQPIEGDGTTNYEIPCHFALG